jgi:nitrate reductase (NAD(P)H)
MLVAGGDATEDFMAIHSSDARKQLANFHIGTLRGDIVESKTTEKDDDSESPFFLNPKKWKKVVLVNIKNVSPNTKIFRFSLPDEEQEVGLPSGQHIYVRLRRKIAHQDNVAGTVKGQLVERTYTPLLERRAKGFIDMLIKYVFNLYRMQHEIEHSMCGSGSTIQPPNFLRADV